MKLMVALVVTPGWGDVTEKAWFVKLPAVMAVVLKLVELSITTAEES